MHKVKKQKYLKCVIMLRHIFPFLPGLLGYSLLSLYLLLLFPGEENKNKSLVVSTLMDRLTDAA